MALFMLVPCAFAAKTTSKKFTKRYKDTRLEVVLKDVCKNNSYTLNVLDKDINLDKLITANFREASTSVVLKKVLDTDCQGKIKKGVLTISKKPEPPVTYTLAAAEPSEVIDNDSITQKTYQDTIVTIACHRETIKKMPESEPVKKEVAPVDSNNITNRREHNIQFLLGAGYSSMGYNLKDDGKEIGYFGGNVQLRYLYYFNENWGIGLGVGFSNYGSTGTLNTDVTYFDAGETILRQSDSENEAYGHTVRTHDWKEQQKAYMVDIPIMAQCTYPLNNVNLKNGHLKLYADLGVNIGLCVAANRKLKDGSIEHIGWYKPWHLELEQIIGHDFYTETVDEFNTDKQEQPLKMPAIGLMGDFGVAIPLTQQLDLLVGAYFNSTLNNMCDNTYSIGWKQDKYDGDLAYRNHDFMNAYAGEIGTQFAQAIRPWQVGVRVGINFNQKTIHKEKQPEPIYDRITVCDTTIAMQPRVETYVKPVVIAKIKKILEKSVIWFDLNSVEPKLQPADILDKVAEVLKEDPNQKVMITGHASKEGNKELNQRLSEGRAQAIVDRLISLGVNPDQMQSQGLGVDRDYLTGSHDISLDRRAEITPINTDADNKLVVEQKPEPAVENNAPQAEEEAEIIED
ncbi:MAG: OmpA family protein [Paludibacteraceae bacterium]|nr:OmpA family protein [Paludibacteraceae bacterium]